MQTSPYVKLPVAIAPQSGKCHPENECRERGRTHICHVAVPAEHVHACTTRLHGGEPTSLMGRGACAPTKRDERQHVRTMTLQEYGTTMNVMFHGFLLDDLNRCPPHIPPPSGYLSSPTFPPLLHIYATSTSTKKLRFTSAMSDARNPICDTYPGPSHA
jgi:hypothetical protein